MRSFRIAHLAVALIAVAIVASMLMAPKPSPHKKMDYEASQAAAEKAIIKKLGIRSRTAFKSEFSGSAEVGSFRYMVFEFNQSGDLSRTLTYERDGRVISGIDYIYDSAENNIETISFGPGGTVESRFACRFDPRGRLVEQLEYRGAALAGKKTCSYDDTGNLILETLEAAGGAKTIKESRYDASGNKVEDRETGPGGESRWEYQYNGRGNRVKDLYHRPDGKVNLWENDYDKEGLMKATRIYSSDGKLSDRFEYDHDSDERMIITKRYGGDGALKVDVRYAYGENGLISSQIEANGNKKPVSFYRYEYNK